MVDEANIYTEIAVFPLRYTVRRRTVKRSVKLKKTKSTQRTTRSREKETATHILMER